MASISGSVLRSQATKLTPKFLQLVAATSSSSNSFTTLPSASEYRRARLQNILTSHAVVVFMKGSPQQACCGFSHVVIDILRLHRIPYSTVNILEDLEVHQSIKELSQWSNFPQIFIGGKFAGDYAELVRMHKSGELTELLKSVGLHSALSPEDLSKTH